MSLLSRLLLAFGVAATLAAAAPKEAPVTIDVAVSPDSIGPGSDAHVTVSIAAKPGIKLNKYPKIKLQVPAVAGLVGEAGESLGNAGPPPPDHIETNYFKGSVDPLKVTLHLDAQAEKGRHEIPAQLSYFYCVAASGYCAPAKAELSIPVTVR